jgi:hypothetical protein
MKRNRFRLAASMGFAALLCDAPAALAQATAPSLGEATPYAVLGGAAVSNTGPSVLNGDLGISPNGAGSITGFPPGIVNGSTHAADGAALNAQNAMTTAYNALFAQACNTTFVAPTDIGGTTQPPGVYCFGSSAAITGDLTLNAFGDPNAVFIFRMGSTLTTAAAARVLLINGAQPCNIFWAVGSSATIGTTTTFVGNILAQTSITVTTGAHLFGRALAKTAVTLDTNIVDATVCSGVGGSGGFCATTGPSITSIPSQAIPALPLNGSVTVGFTISGSVIADALGLTVTSSDNTLVPQSAMVITRGAGGARLLTISGADGRSGVATITVTVNDPAGCSTSTRFTLTLGTVPVPTLPQWAMFALSGLLVFAGWMAMRRRGTLDQER